MAVQIEEGAILSNGAAGLLLPEKTGISGSFGELGKTGKKFFEPGTYARDGSFVFDGLVKQAQTSKGAAEIATFLRMRYGGGQEGPTAKSISSMMIDAPANQSKPKSLSLIPRPLTCQTASIEKLRAATKPRPDQRRPIKPTIDAPAWCSSA